MLPFQVVRLQMKEQLKALGQYESPALPERVSRRSLRRTRSLERSAPTSSTFTTADVARVPSSHAAVDPPDDAAVMPKHELPATDGEERRRGLRRTLSLDRVRTVMMGTTQPRPVAAKSPAEQRRTSFRRTLSFEGLERRASLREPDMASASPREIGEPARSGSLRRSLSFGSLPLRMLQGATTAIAGAVGANSSTTRARRQEASTLEDDERWEEDEDDSFSSSSLPSQRAERLSGLDPCYYGPVHPRYLRIRAPPSGQHTSSSALLPNSPDPPRPPPPFLHGEGEAYSARETDRVSLYSEVSSPSEIGGAFSDRVRRRRKVHRSRAKSAPRTSSTTQGSVAEWTVAGQTFGVPGALQEAAAREHELHAKLLKREAASQAKELELAAMRATLKASLRQVREAELHATLRLKQAQTAAEKVRHSATSEADIVSKFLSEASSEQLVRARADAARAPVDFLGDGYEANAVTNEAKPPWEPLQKLFAPITGSPRVAVGENGRTTATVTSPHRPGETGSRARGCEFWL